MYGYIVAIRLDSYNLKILIFDLCLQLNSQTLIFYLEHVKLWVFRW